MWVNEIYRSFGSRCKSRVIVNHGLVVVVVVVVVGWRALAGP